MILFRVEGLLSALFFAYVYVLTIFDRIKICKNDTKICIYEKNVVPLTHFSVTTELNLKNLTF